MSILVYIILNLNMQINMTYSVVCDVLNLYISVKNPLSLSNLFFLSGIKGMNCVILEKCVMNTFSTMFFPLDVFFQRYSKNKHVPLYSLNDC